MPRPKDVPEARLLLRLWLREVPLLGEEDRKEGFVCFYLGSYDEDVLRQFIECHKAHIQRLEEKLAVHRRHLELAERVGPNARY